MTVGEKLKQAREFRGLSYAQLAEKSGLKKSTLQRYETGTTRKIPIEAIGILETALGLEPGSLMDWTNKDSIVMPEIKNVITRIPMFNIPVSAGTGQWLSEGHEYEFKYFNNVPEGADFALKVRGDSMEPMYFDDDIVFVKQNVIVESGQIGVFFLNGEGYMKMLQGNKLVSLNPKYTPIIINELDSFFCAGRIIGKSI